MRPGTNSSASVASRARSSGLRRRKHWPRGRDRSTRNDMKSWQMMSESLTRDWITSIRENRMCNSLPSERRSWRLFALIVCVVVLLCSGSSCRRNRSNGFVIVLADNVKTIDPIGSPSVDAASERVRALMFNSLVKKDEKFDYVPELASNIQRSDDGLTFTFTMRDGVTFHDGRPFTSADAKYTLDTVLGNSFAKSASFFEGTGANRTAYVRSIEAPDAHTLVIQLSKQWTGLLPNLVTIAMIPKDGYESQKTHHLGTGP